MFVFSILKLKYRFVMSLSPFGCKYNKKNLTTKKKEKKMKKNFSYLLMVQNYGDFRYDSRGQPVPVSYVL